MKQNERKFGLFRNLTLRTRTTSLNGKIYGKVNFSGSLTYNLLVLKDKYKKHYCIIYSFHVKNKIKRN